VEPADVAAAAAALLLLLADAACQIGIETGVEICIIGRVPGGGRTGGEEGREGW